jgi:prepilin-type N-terminal cleavage/methylation domain-containing protein
VKLQIKNTKKGFTLLELLFVIGIFSILTSITIYNYGDFNNNIIMSNMAYEVALEIRQAQVYGLSVRGVSTAAGQLFDTRYGVTFGVDYDAEGRDANKDFVIFSDYWPYKDPEDGIDTPSGDGFCNSVIGTLNSRCSVSYCEEDGECLEKITLLRGISFNKICVIAETDGNPVDFATGGCSDLASEQDSVHITFARPYTNAMVNFEGGDTDEKYNVGIVLQSTAGSQKAVIVKASGQISVENVTGRVD